MFNPFKRKPKIVISTNQKGEITVAIINSSLEKCIVLIYAACCQVADMLKVNRRFFLNQLIETDKAIEKGKRDQEKQEKRDKFNQFRHSNQPKPNL